MLPVMSETWGGTTLLDDPPEAVWDFLTDDGNDVNWRQPYVRAVRKLTDGPLAIGTRYETLYRFFGRPERTIVEITELEAPRRMAWRQVDSPTVVSNVGSYDLEPAPGGRTRFTVTGVVRSRSWRHVIDGPFMRWLSGAPVRRQHAQLAAALRARKAAV
jgi:uncharacterized protein YndB with AHSA1/START domain